jgi:hypothetical protein
VNAGARDQGQDRHRGAASVEAWYLVLIDTSPSNKTALNNSQYRLLWTDLHGSMAVTHEVTLLPAKASLLQVVKMVRQ